MPDLCAYLRRLAADRAGDDDGDRRPMEERPCPRGDGEDDRIGACFGSSFGIDDARVRRESTSGKDPITMRPREPGPQGTRKETCPPTDGESEELPREVGAR